MIDKQAFNTAVFTPMIKSLARKFVRAGMSEELAQMQEAKDMTTPSTEQNTKVVLVPTPVIEDPYSPTVIAQVPQNTGGNE